MANAVLRVNSVRLGPRRNSVAMSVIVRPASRSTTKLYLFAYRPSAETHTACRVLNPSATGMGSLGASRGMGTPWTYTLE